MGATLLVTGDLMLQKAISDRDHEGLQWLQREFRSADAVFANLELALTRRGESADKVVLLRGDPSLAGDLRRFGVSAVTIANNHATDYGITGLRDTLSALSSAGIASCGGGETVAQAFAPAFLDLSGMRVALLGMACTLPPGAAAMEERPGLAPIRVVSRFVIDAATIDEQPGTAPYVETVALEGDVQRSVRAVAEAKAQADAVIVGIHWGVPNGWMAAFQGPLADYQRPLAHALIDAGADAVVGHHAHVLHGVEIYQGRPILYSLGNFLFHSLLNSEPPLTRPYPRYGWGLLRGFDNHLGALAALQLRAGAAPRLLLRPLWLDESGEPTAADADAGRHVLERLATHSRPFGVRFEEEGGWVKAEA